MLSTLQNREVVIMQKYTLYINTNENSQFQLKTVHSIQNIDVHNT